MKKSLGQSSGEYLSELESLRDKYLSKGTDEWFSYTEKIYDFKKEMAEDAQNRELELLNYNKNMGIISQEEYYQKLEEFRDKYFDVGSSEWLSYTEKIREFNVSKIKNAYDEIADYAGETFGEITQKQKSLYKSLDETGGILHTVTIRNFFEDGSAVTIDEIADISRQNDFLKEFSERITLAAERIKNSGMEQNAAAKLFDEMISLSPQDASSFADLLVRADDEKFKKFISGYEENANLLESSSINPFRDEWNKAIDDFNDFSEEVLEKAGVVLPEGYSLIGSSAAEEFCNAFKAKTDVFMKAFSENLSDFTASITAGLTSGLSQKVFSPTYNLYGSGETVTEQIRSAKAAAEKDRMAGGY